MRCAAAQVSWAHLPGLSSSVFSSVGEGAVTNWLMYWTEQPVEAPQPPLPGAKPTKQQQQQQQQQQQPAKAGDDAAPPAGAATAPPSSSLPAAAAADGKEREGKDKEGGRGGRAQDKPSQAQQRRGVVAFPVGLQLADPYEQQLWQTFRDMDKGECGTLKRVTSKGAAACCFSLPMALLCAQPALRVHALSAGPPAFGLSSLWRAARVCARVRGADHNGVLDAEELTHALTSLGLPCSHEYIEDMMKQ